VAPAALASPVPAHQSVVLLSWVDREEDASHTRDSRTSAWHAVLCHVVQISCQPVNGRLECTPAWQVLALTAAAACQDRLWAVARHSALMAPPRNCC
jgi:hypothetical protein